MTTTEYIDHILQSLEMPMWGRWNVTELISASSDSAVFGMESKCMNRAENAVLKIVPLIASQVYVTNEQKQAQIERAKQQAEQESALLFRLRGCPYIVTYQDEDLREIEIDGHFEGYAHLIRMAALEGLAEQIRSQRFYTDEENVRRLAADLLQAILYAHRLGITHGGIRPEKIFLTAGGAACLGGFHTPPRSGVMHIAADSDAYIAPELLTANPAALSPQADIYALGICLYQLMNGMDLPFEPALDPDAAWKKRMDGAPLPKPVKGSDVMSAIILKACAFSPEERYQSAEDMLADIMFCGKDMKRSALHLAPADPAEAPAPNEAAAEEWRASASPEQRPAAEDTPAAQETQQAPEPQAAPEQSAAAAPQNSEQPEPDADAFVVQDETVIRYQGNATVIQIPQGVTAIGAGAFENCTLIQRVIIPQGVVRIDEKAFANCTGLESVQFPVSLRVVNDNAFMNCTQLQEAIFNGILSQIGARAFDGCSGLRTVAMNSPMEKIGHDAFAGCTSLEKIEVSAYSYAYKSVDGVLFDYECKYLLRYPAGRRTAEYTVPETVFAVEDGAFYGCAFLERVQLTRNVKRIGASAFRDCTGLLEIGLPDMLETVKASAFQGCTSLRSVSLPAKATYLGNYAFSHCENLETVELPAKMSELCMGVFEYCKKLTFLRLPENIIQIGERAFMGSGLRELFVPFAASKIEKQAFADCTDLEIIFLSHRLTLIAQNAFAGCKPELTICGLPDSMPAEYASTLGFSFKPVFALSVQGKQVTLQRYDGAFTHIIIPPEVNIIGDAAFQGCLTLHSLVISPGVGAVGKNTFEGCANLEYLTLTNLLIRAGDNAFAGCNALKQIRIADLSNQFEPKVQLKIHRNFYQVLLGIREDIAAEYARKYGIQ